MKREYTKAKLGSERTAKRKKPLDRLTRDALAAQAAGMSYGKYKAMHPHTDEEESEPEELTVDPSKRALVCVKCGKLWVPSGGRRYCSQECSIIAGRERSRENERKRREREKEAKANGST